MFRSPRMGFLLLSLFSWALQSCLCPKSQWNPASKGLSICCVSPAPGIREVFPKILEQRQRWGSASRAERVPAVSQGEKEHTELCWGGWGPPQITAAIGILERFIHPNPHCGGTRQPRRAEQQASRCPPARPSQTPNPRLCLSSSSFLMHSDYPASRTASEHLNTSPSISHFTLEEKHSTEPRPCFIKPISATQKQ